MPLKGGTVLENLGVEVGFVRGDEGSSVKINQSRDVAETKSNRAVGPDAANIGTGRAVIGLPFRRNYFEIVNVLVSQAHLLE